MFLLKNTKKNKNTEKLAKMMFITKFSAILLFYAKFSLIKSKNLLISLISITFFIFIVYIMINENML